MSAIVAKWIGGLLPPAVFVWTLWLLLEPKCTQKAARWAMAGFLGLELAVQYLVYAWDGSPELVFTLLPLTLYLPAILGAHLVSKQRFLPTAVGWLLALLCSHLLLAGQKIAAKLSSHLSGEAWTWTLTAVLALAAAGLVAAVRCWMREPFRTYAQTLEEQWSPLLVLPVMLLVLHSYFLSSASTIIGLLLLLFTALAALWAMTRLMSALTAQRQAQVYQAQMAALQQDHELLQKKLELGRSYRHDQRHHMLALSALLQDGKTDAALAYVADWQGQLTQIESRSWCGSAAVNAVLSAYLAQAEKAGCAVEAEVALPGELNVEELDLCVVLANALENAIHACQGQSEDAPRNIKLELTMTDHRLTLHMENSCAQAVEIGEDGLPVGEHKPGHGQGLKSIAAVAKKYNGMFQCDYADGLFSLWVVLLDAAPESRRTRRAPAVCAGVLLGVFLLNGMPALAQALESVPVLGPVIRVVDLRSYSRFWGDTGVSVDEPILDGDSQAVEQAEAEMEEFISRMKEVFLFHAAQKYQGYVSEDVSYEVLRDDDALFILRFDGILYAGNSVEYHRHVVLDKGTGQVLELADLFLEDVNYVFPINREIKAQMEEQVNADVADYFLPGGIWPEEECFQSIDPEEQDFYINEDGQLVIVFAEYEVAPGSMGTPEFTIPTDLLDGLLPQPSLLK